ncbi:Uncharacterized protein OS=Syntrophobacter fumaroxidans (strain DSM 10017 / MPOB) GN=Sfum_3784 PE=4 SV=1 [Gemmata massiliana]|uniref:Uncharacterized protein n=1 Tax=Gemmata massiliana TaxID=1210884 RepID=A0A6P2CU43_9BACT|nr:hypothetical protein [Gemmata massiliana]VTR92501.1 Uncharacterized protein OS=Syntrophobacter fumaroxidans (strain DSM 10017 / MPOB) GN=Sfum_3784 PE=4 SV=1 [Gemmata massiliana]
MSSDAYRYHFQSEIPAAEVEATLILSILGAEALHGEAQTRLDAGHAFDPKRRVVVIDAGTAVGRDLSRLFIGFLTREFGTGSFRVERVAHEPEPSPHTRVETVTT